MGAKTTKDTFKNVNDYSIITIPKNYTMLKIISYCIDLRISANIDLKIAEIISYIMNTKKNKKADIINLQGIRDILSLHLLVREIKKYCLEYNIKLYFAPEFDDIDVDSELGGTRNGRRSRNLEEFSTKQTTKNPRKSSEQVGKQIVHNIILSVYPIVGTIFAELDDKTNMDDIFGIHSVIGANILIDDTVISIYNTCLSKDIRTSNIINDAVRTTELETLCKIINKNKINARSDIHMLIGNLHIPEISNDDINEEYISSIKNKHFVDIFRYKFPKEFGYTTSYNERNSYILLYIEDAMRTTIQDSNYEDVLNILYKQYKIHFMDLSVINTNKNVINYPIECVCMVKTS